MRSILRIKFGSHLYGTATPQSDLDFKSIFVPDARDILLGRVKRSISTKRAKAEGEKNFAGEVDEEAYSLQSFLSLAAEGQTVALDVLFAPAFACVEKPSDEWQEIIANREKLLTRKSAAFVGYCRQQANKYGIKGSRVAAARKALVLLNDAVEANHGNQKLGDLATSCDDLARSVEHIEIVPIEQMGGTIVNHLEVCGRKLSYNASIRHGRDVLAKLVAEYGQRALQAESQQGVDWKALSHAVRVGTQAIELLRTGKVTFPLLNAERVLAIKLGQIPYQKVSQEIETLLEKVETEAAISILRPEPDYQWIDDFVARVYRNEIIRSTQP